MPPKAKKTDSTAAAAAADNDPPSFLTDRQVNILVQILRSNPRSLKDLNINIAKAAENLGMATGSVRNAWAEIKRKFTAEATGDDEDGEPAAEDANPAPKKRARTGAAKRSAAPRGKSGAAAAAADPVRGRVPVNKTSIMAPMAAPLSRPAKDDEETEQKKAGKEDDDDTVDEDGAEAGEV